MEKNYKNNQWVEEEVSSARVQGWRRTPLVRIVIL